MPYSVPNQKWIQVHKPRVTERFLQISHEDWMQANKTLSPYGLQLYLYLASNNDNYEFALSPADAEVCAGIKNTSFRKYMKRLEEEGYIVWRKGNVFDFYMPERRSSKLSTSLALLLIVPSRMRSFRRIPFSPSGCSSTRTKAIITRQSRPN